MKNKRALVRIYDDSIWVDNKISRRKKPSQVMWKINIIIQLFRNDFEITNIDTEYETENVPHDKYPELRVQRHTGLETITIKGRNK